MWMWRRVDHWFERLAAVDSRYFATVFFLALLGYTLALLQEAIGYSADPRLFPMIVGVPLVLLLVAKILLLLFGDRFDLRTVDFFEDLGEMDVAATGGVTDRAARYRRELSMVAWIGGLSVLIYLFGNLVAVPVFIFAFILAWERDPLRAALVAAVTFAFIFLLFVEVLNASLWRGIVPLGGLLP